MTVTTIPFAKPTAGERHPQGLYVLSFTEAWERFSFYGMQALLVLYMVDQALTPGHIETIAGMGGLRAALESVFGPLSIQALSSQIFGLYTGFVYFTPIIGGWLGDQVWGRRTTVLVGAMLMALGHLLMAFEASFLIALLLLILGSGCLKGNISAQVGDLYDRGDPRRTPAFSLFNLGINIGAFTAPLVCGTLGELYGWHLGFGLAAGGMLLGATIYLAGRRHIPDHPPVRRAKTHPPVSAADRRKFLALVGMLVISTFYSTAYAQEFNVFNIWVRDTVDRNVFGFQMPVTWFAALDGLFCILAIPLVLRWWAWRQSRGVVQDDLGRLGWGSFYGMIGMLALVAASMLAAAGHAPGVGWGVFCFAMYGIGFVYNWPVTLAICSRNAPASLGGAVMGLAFLTNFVANYLSGVIGAYYETMTPTMFWLLHAAISGAGCVLVFAMGRPLSRALD